MALTLRIVHITDVYKLDNFPSLKTLVKQKKAECPNTISIFTGDFLAPSLLSSLDKGSAMMHMITKVPITYLTWGNHEADIPHYDVCRQCYHYHKAGGIFINSNMQSHEMMPLQKPFEVLTVKSVFGAGEHEHVRKVGFIGVLTNDPALYRKFKAPGAFNGAKIECPWETLRKYKKILEEQHKCDLIIPLEHLYEPEDQRTCEEFDFPLVLSGHDHHVVDRVINKTRLLKPGSDANHAYVIDITWDTPEDKEPRIAVKLENVQDYVPDPDLTKQMQICLAPLEKLKKTQLAPVAEQFRPLSSMNIRGQVTTIGKFICSLLRNSINSDSSQENVEVSLVCGGNLHAEKDYPDEAFFSLEDLLATVDASCKVWVVEISGELLAKAAKSTWEMGVNRFYLQYDDKCASENGELTMLAGQPVDPERIYKVVTMVDFAQIPALVDYFKARPPPDVEELNSVHFEILAHCGRVVWNEILWLCDRHGHADPSLLDADGDGVITAADLQVAMRKIGYSVSKDEFSLVEMVVRCADDDDEGSDRSISVDAVLNAFRKKRRSRMNSFALSASAQMSGSSSGVLLPTSSY
eukprot:RCo050883